MTRWQQNSSGLLLANLFLLLICAYLTTGNPVPIATIETINTDTNGYYVLDRSEQTAGTYKKAAVAASSKQCAEVGAKMLEKNGTAVDAAIATLLCDGVVSLQGLGIGGGFLMTIWNATEKKAYFLNAREYAPAAAYETIFTASNKLEGFIGAKSIAIPGEIAGYYEAHRRFGKLPWKDLFEDAIRICKEGSYVSRYVANDIKKVTTDLNKSQFSSLKSILVNTNDDDKTTTFMNVGDRIHRQKLADTLTKISEHGRDIFYKGEIADNLVREIQAAGGIITKEDFENYEPQWKDPVNTTINGKTLYSAPTPGSGAVLGFMLNVLQKLIPAPNKNVMYQRIAETFKWGYARRSEIGDFIERPEYANKKSKADCKIDLAKEEELKSNGYYLIERNGQKWDKDCLMSVAFHKLLDKDYADEVIKEIKDDRTFSQYEHYNITKVGRIDLGTAHASVYAEDGSAVSVTSTINHVLGSLIRSESTGIILNNEMDDYCYPGIRNGFNVEPSEFNFVRQGSTLRPMSSMSPSIIVNEDKTVRLVIGSAGGTKITTGVTQGIINNLILGEDIKTSLDKPRIHHNLWTIDIKHPESNNSVMAVELEPDFDPEVKQYLGNIGHELSGWNVMTNTLAAVSVNENDITASGDFRREGGTSGY